MIVRERHIVENCEPFERMEAYCFGKISGLTTRKGIKKAIKRGELLLNSKKECGSEFVKQGDVIEWVYADKVQPFKLFPLDLEILYEDEHLAVMNKPPGFPVSGNYHKTIEHALPHNLKPSGEQDALPYPLPCHRLDRSTSGCLLVAKTYAARIHIGAQFENSTIQKVYHALVVGGNIDNQEINFPIDSKTSLSSLELVQSVPSLTNGLISLIKLIPHTGRTHQLRIHCAEIQHPILGDPLYGNPASLLKGKGLFLASTQVSFIHPASGERKVVESCIPNKFAQFIVREEKRYLAFSKDDK